MLPLSNFIGNSDYNAKDHLRIAINIVETLLDLHNKSLIHSNLSPQCINLDSKTFKCEITKLDTASKWGFEQRDFDAAKHLSGDLSYISPEHTGRTNKRLDFRSDIYSIGMILYELFTGSTAFGARDALTLLHAHLVRIPTPPHECNRQTPEIVSDIICKCIDKNPDSRYQGARGLLEDLRTALKKCNPIGHIPKFVLAKHDTPAQFTIPQKLYGRETQMQAVHAIFSNICDGDSHLLLLSGRSGIGKTVLIKELYNPITEKDAILLRGKFEEFNSNVPYRAFAQAFNEWANIVFSQDEEEQLRWKSIIQKAVGNNGKLLVDLAPDIGKLLGDQPPLPELGPSEAQHRFNNTITQFLSALTNDGERIVLFLDDLQWADSGALSLLKHIALTIQIPRLMAIGAYRDTEFDVANWLGTEIDRTTTTEMNLVPISQADIMNMVNDIFGSQNPKNQKLAKILHDKTLGNPFFVNQILQHMHRENCFTLNTQTGHWEWDTKTVTGLMITENVVDFLLSQITASPESAQNLLKTLAIMGTKGNLINLITISPLEANKCIMAISLLINKSYVTTNASYTQLTTALQNDNASEQPIPIELGFAHDRIQEASYKILRSKERIELHLAQARYLLQPQNLQENDQALYNLLYHCDQCHTQFTTNEHVRVSKLYLLAGKRAKTTMSYASAIRFLTMGLELLKERNDHQSLIFELEFEKAENLFLAGSHNEANQLFDALLLKASNEEKVEIYDKRTILESFLGNADKSVDFGLKGLRLVQLKLNPRPSQLSIFMRILKIKWLIRNKKITDLSLLPKMTNTQVLTQMRLIMNIAGPAYQASPDLFTILVLEQTIQTLKYGLTEFASTAFCGYAIILGPGLGDYTRSYEFGILHKKINKDYYSETLIGKDLFVFAAFISPWNKPIRDVYELLWKSTKINLQNGDFAYASWALFTNLHLHFLNGETLSKVQTLLHDNSATAKNEVGSYHNMLITQYAIESLTENSGSIAKLGNSAFDEESFVNNIEKLVIKPPQCWYYIVKQMLCYFAGEYDASLEYSKKANKMISVALGFYWFQTHYFFTFMALAAKYDSAGMLERIALKFRMRTPHKKFKKWAYHCPENFAHKLSLIQAELARINGHPSRSLTHYDNAIAHSNSQEFTHHTAIIAECAAKTCLSIGNTSGATHYLETAVSAYQEWGAIKKANQLFEHYQEYLQNFMTKQDQAKLEAELEAHKNSLDKPENMHDNFDSMAIIKASQVISSQIILEDLLSNLIHVLLEAAGAEAAAIILNRNDELTIVASRNALTEKTVLSPIHLKDTDELVKTLVRTCWNTKKIAIIENASDDDATRHSPYVKQHKIKS
ncbi:MAG: AAA family ATPase, partial [bacterium]|nr:AAA family ATPase [bacterium]